MDIITSRSHEATEKKPKALSKYDGFNIIISPINHISCRKNYEPDSLKQLRLSSDNQTEFEVQRNRYPTPHPIYWSAGKAQIPRRLVHELSVVAQNELATLQTYSFKLIHELMAIWSTLITRNGGFS